MMQRQLRQGVKDKLLVTVKEICCDKILDTDQYSTSGDCDSQSQNCKDSYELPS